MHHSIINNLKKGDLLIYTPTNCKMPILDIHNGKLTTLYKGRNITRALGQLSKLSRDYIVIKDGEELSRDLAFYDPVSSKMIILTKGSVYLGEV